MNDFLGFCSSDESSHFVVVSKFETHAEVGDDFEASIVVFDEDRYACNAVEQEVRRGPIVVIQSPATCLIGLELNRWIFAPNSASRQIDLVRSMFESLRTQ